MKFVCRRKILQCSFQNNNTLCLGLASLIIEALFILTGFSTEILVIDFRRYLGPLGSSQMLSVHLLMNCLTKAFEILINCL